MKQEKQIYEKELSELLRELGCRDTGLSNSEAESRLVKYGANELHTGKQKSIFRIFLGNLLTAPGGVKNGGGGVYQRRDPSHYDYRRS